MIPTDAFAALASSTNGIAKLRQLILELAVRGLLVPQDPNDEPASALLERINVEKQQLLKEKNSKSQNTSVSITSEEQPFLLPAGWIWTRLHVITSKIGAGSTPLGGQKSYVDQGIKFLRSQNIWNDGLRLFDAALIDENTHKKMSGTHVCAGDLLFNITGASIGRCALVPDDFDTANVSQHVTIVRPVLNETRHFLHKILISNLVQNTVMNVQVGVSREGLSISKLGQFLIPMPPIEEQHRIVRKINELMNLCDQLDQGQNHSATVHQRLLQTLLESLTQAVDHDAFQKIWSQIAAHFDTLFTTEASIDQLKQVILQLAVMGKLVPQAPSDEPASVLLDKINVEKQRLIKEGKIKKQKALPEITENDKPYKLPVGWEWARLGNLCTKLTDGSHNPPRDVRNGIPMLSSQNVRYGVVDFTNPSRYVSQEDFEKEDQRTQILPNDVLLTIVASLGRSAIVPNNAPKFVLQRSVAVLRSDLDADFLALQLVAPTCLHYYDTHGKGTAQKGIYLGKLSLMEIAVPPLAEQRRIVTKVDELMAICDLLKSRISKSQQTQEHLATAIVEKTAA